MDKCKEQCFSIKWTFINEEVAYKRIINCTNVELRNIKKYPYKIRFKWKNKITNI
jgi:hypothetical protein